MATVVALVSVITSGCVALMVPLVASRQSRALRLLDVEVEQVRDLRTVLEDGGVRLARAERSVDAAQQVAEASELDPSRRQAVGNEPVSLMEDPVRLAAAGDAIVGVHESLHRIAVNLGWDSSPARAYAEALRHLDARLLLLNELRDGGPDLADERGWQEVSEALGDLQGAYEKARAAFGDEASALVGWHGENARSQVHAARARQRQLTRSRI